MAQTHEGRPEPPVTGAPRSAPVSARVPAAAHPGALDRWALAWLRAAFGGAPVRLRLWNGVTETLAPGAVATIDIRDRRTLFDLILRGEVGFGEAYTDGRLDIDRDLAATLDGVYRAMAGRWPTVPHLPRRATGASLRAARQNVHAHYDLGNDFYRLWLDEAMVYTCAYFERPDQSLEEAQQAKLDYVCRKLALRPGERVIEAGSGWGALALHMARRFGVTVRAYNVSSEQLAWARARAQAEGLADRVTFIGEDYRAIEGECDAFVSIGMLEHVGTAQYGALGDVIARVLHPDHGRGLLHFIGRNQPAPFSPWVSRYIFPGAHAPALSEVLPAVLERFDLSVTDVENLRLHYATTLSHWLARFEASRDRVRAMFDDRFVRMWQLYLASAQASFSSGDLQLFQIAFARPAVGTAPATRRSLYERAT